MIEKLTEEQKVKFNEYVDKWTKVGLSTERVNEQRATVIMNRVYKDILEKPLVPVVVVPSPLSAWYLTCLLVEETNINKDTINKARERVKDIISGKDSTYEKVGYVHSFLDGNWDVGFFSFYDYMETELGIPYSCKEKWDVYKMTTELGPTYTLDNIGVVSDKPIEINLVNGVLHADGKPAIVYSDGFEVYSLNGVRMPEQFVMTPAEKLDPMLVLNEKNVDVQRELIRKIGIERVIKKVGAKEIDKWTDPKTNLDYSLLSFKLGDNIDRKYMYFEHAGLKGVYYAQPVPPEVNKCVFGRAWMLSIIDREFLQKITPETEYVKQLEVEMNLPSYVS